MSKRVRLTHSYYDNTRLWFRGDVVEIPDGQPIPPSVDVNEDLPDEKPDTWNQEAVTPTEALIEQRDRIDAILAKRLEDIKGQIPEGASKSSKETAPASAGQKTMAGATVTESKEPAKELPVKETSDKKES